MRYGLWVAIGIILLALIGQTQSWLPGLARWTYDMQVRLTATGHAPSGDVAIIKIDDASLKALGRWPWPRDVQAQLLHTLADYYQVTLIGLDMVMAEPETNALQAAWPQLCQDLGGAQSGPCAVWQARLQPLLQPERRFTQVVSQLPVVGGMYFLPERGAAGVLPQPIAVQNPRQLALFPAAQGYGGNWEGLANALPKSGFLNTMVDSDGVVRRVPLIIQYQDRLYPSLVAAMAAQLSEPKNPTIEVMTLSDESGFQQLDAIVLGRILIRRTDQAGRVLLPQFGPAGTIAGFSAIDVLQRRIDVRQLAGRAVIVGATAPGLLDIRATPISPTYPGLEAQASLLQAVLSNQLAWSPPWAAVMILPVMIFIGGFLVWRFNRDGFIRCHLWFFTALLLLLAVSVLAWHVYRWVLPLVWPFILVVGLYLWMVLAARLVAFRQHRLLRERFGEYIPPQIVDKLDTATLQQGMSPELKKMTVLFTDVKDFTAIAEQLNPADLADLLNQYLSVMTEQIHAQQGVVDKYIGDAIMAFWGAPVADELQIEHAVQTGLAMQASLAALNLQFATRNWPQLGIGLAIHTGEMRVGNMGSRYRRAYTVLGDAVNVASRTESLTRVYQQTMLVTEEVAAALPNYDWLEIDYVRVKGRQQAFGIYILPANDTAAWRESWLQMRAACRRGDGHAALALLALCRALGLEDGLYHSYQTRLPEWPSDGVWSWQAK
ncbi:adenylate/guanylate cyclase domain-containing protein [Chitinibacter sp. SCUT-21]|uniref:CHASE2 domain-containing protein n=1 Tax=Chitinibacter sp. SCUT-21 TaxID=2970891 RepID=UPI0035A6E382